MPRARAQAHTIRSTRFSQPFSVVQELPTAPLPPKKNRTAHEQSPPGGGEGFSKKLFNSSGFVQSMEHALRGVREFVRCPAHELRCGAVRDSFIERMAGRHETFRYIPIVDKIIATSGSGLCTFDCKFYDFPNPAPQGTGTQIPGLQQQDVKEIH